jgi:hypothetical protein
MEPVEIAVAIVVGVVAATAADLAAKGVKNGSVLEASPSSGLPTVRILLRKGPLCGSR